MSVRDVLIGSAISVVSTIGVQTYLFKRTKHFEYKNLVNNLYQLSIEALERSQVQLAQLGKHVDTIKRDPSNLRRLLVTGYKPWAILATEIIKDSNYTAFQRVFRNHLNANETYYKLRRFGLSLNEIVIQMQEVAEGALGKYQQALNELKDLIQGDFIQVKQLAFKDYGAQYEISLQIIRTILTTVQNQNPPLTIQQLFNTVFVPVYDVIVQTGKNEGTWPTALIDFHRVVERIVFGFRDVIRQNESYLNELGQLRGQMEISLSEIIHSNAFFRERLAEFMF